jgi:elongation factor Ts
MVDLQMPNFTAQDVQALRKSTGAGMLDAKRALEATDGDAVEAAKWLREQGLAGAAKRMDREAGEGTVALVELDGLGAIVEIKCETDFVAKAPEIVGLANDLAGLVAEKGEDAVHERDSQIDDFRTSLKENISVGRVVRYEAGESGVLGGYLHIQNHRGVNGVLIELRGGEPELAHDIAVHIASQRPKYISRDEVPAADVAEERATVEQIARNEGKPEAQLPKIVEGRMNGFFRDLCLLEQPFVKDEKKTIADLLGSAEVVRFAQVEVGA